MYQFSLEAFEHYCCNIYSIDLFKESKSPKLDKLFPIQECVQAILAWFMMHHFCFKIMGKVLSPTKLGWDTSASLVRIMIASNFNEGSWGEAEESRLFATCAIFEH